MNRIRKRRETAEFHDQSQTEGQIELEKIKTENPREIIKNQFSIQKENLELKNKIENLEKIINADNLQPRQGLAYYSVIQYDPILFIQYMVYILYIPGTCLYITPKKFNFIELLSNPKTNRSRVKIRK